jgi:hypothetical protein
VNCSPKQRHTDIAEPQFDVSETTTPSNATPAGRPSTPASTAPPSRDDSVEIVEPDESQNPYQKEVEELGKFEHRLSLPHRASLNNAADSHFKTSTSLVHVYHYLDVNKESVVYGDFNVIEALTLRCGICNRAGKAMKGWNVNGRA